MRSTGAADVAIQLAYASKVVVAPGYGMAVAQAQHTVRELADELEKRGIEVDQALGGFRDVVDRFHHRQHHPADRRVGQQLEVIGPPGRSEAVDADPIAVAGVQPLDHVVAGGGFVLRGDRVLDVEDDDVGAGVGRGRESFVLRTVDQQPTPGEYRIDPRPNVGRLVSSSLVGHPFIVAYRLRAAQSGVL